MVLVAASLPVLLHGYNQNYELMSSLINKYYFKSQSSDGFIYKKSACNISLGCEPWTALDNGLGMLWPVREAMKCIPDWLNSRTSLCKYVPQYASAMISSVASKALRPRSPQWTSTAMRNFNSLEIPGIYIRSLFFLMPSASLFSFRRLSYQACSFIMFWLIIVVIPFDEGMISPYRTATFWVVVFL